MALPVRNNERFTTEELVADVKAHALTYYNQNGWDFVVETMEDSDIAELIGKATSKFGARNRVYRHVKVLDDHRKEVRATAF